MIRGIYTGAAGMTAMQHKMDVVSNNLANVDKTAFKKDSTIFKTFPEMLLHRTNDDGIGWMPLGSFDIAPLTGKLGTGVEVNEIYTRFNQGSMKLTNKNTDLALSKDGDLKQHPSFFVVQTNRGARLTRSGAFILNKDGFLVTPDGFPLLGEQGPIKVNRNNFLIKENGDVVINNDLGNDPEVIYGKDKNDFSNPVIIDRIQMRTVDYPRHLDKVGTSFYNTTPESGEMRLPTQKEMPEVLQGYLEASNVNLVREMTNMIEVQRAYEMNQKAISTHDSMLGRAINEVAR